VIIVSDKTLLVFDPKYTEVVFLDTECYVPREDRVEGPSSMIVNPANPNHILLGGVFVREFPLQKRSDGLSIFGVGRKRTKRPH
jgi:hypothetical protein